MSAAQINAFTSNVLPSKRWDDVGLAGGAYACTANCTTGCFGEEPRFNHNFCPAWSGLDHFRGCGGKCDDVSFAHGVADKCVQYFDACEVQSQCLPTATATEYTSQQTMQPSTDCGLDRGDGFGSPDYTECNVETT